MSLPADIARQLQQLFREQAHAMRQIAHDAVTQAFGGRMNGGKLDGDAVLAATSTGLGVVEPDNTTITINGSGVISAVGSLTALGIQAGPVSLTISSGAATATAAVTFPVAYSGPPVVVICGADTTFIAAPQAVSTTGFTVKVETAVPVTTDTTCVVYWHAVPSPYSHGQSIQGGGVSNPFASQSIQGGGVSNLFASHSIQGGGYTT